MSRIMAEVSWPFAISTGTVAPDQKPLSCPPTLTLGDFCALPAGWRQIGMPKTRVRKMSRGPDRLGESVECVARTPYPDLCGRVLRDQRTIPDARADAGNRSGRKTRAVYPGDALAKEC